MDKNTAKRYRPLVRATIQTLSLDEATDAILALWQQLTTRNAEPAPAPPAEPQRRRSPPKQQRDDPPPPDPPRVIDTEAPLDPQSFFSPEEAANYLGLEKSRVYQILRSTPEKLPHKREPGRGYDTYHIRGSGINQLRASRMMKGKVKIVPQADDEEEDEEEGGEEKEGARRSNVVRGPF